VATDGVIIQVAGPTGLESLAVDAIAIRGTTLSSANLFLTVVLFVGVPLVLRMMALSTAQDDLDVSDVTPVEAAGVRPSPAVSKRTLADSLNASRWLPVVVAVIIIVALARQWAERGTAAIGLNFVNSVFLGLGLLLHRNLMSYLEAVAEGGRAIVGIVIQFPLYSGIQGVMAGAGLAAAISQGFVEASQAIAEALHVSVHQTFPLATFVSAGVVNFLVPSGGGQWMVQGPIMCSAAHTLSVPLDQTVMAIAYGDQLTNMVQPFWAIPLIGMTRVDAREFMGYCALLMLLATPVFALALLLF
jgi:short-chain fatty acids transporter